MNFLHSVIGGRLTAKPELKTTQKGEFVCSFTIAVNIGSGEKRRAEFTKCVAYNQHAELICRHFDKGSPIMVVCGKGWRTTEWTGRDGKPQKSVEHRVTDVYFVADSAPAAEALKTPDFSAPDFEVTDDPDCPF